MIIVQCCISDWWQFPEVSKHVNMQSCRTFGDIRKNIATLSIDMTYTRQKEYLVQRCQLNTDHIQGYNRMQACDWSIPVLCWQRWTRYSFRRVYIKLQMNITLNLWFKLFLIHWHKQFELFCILIELKRQFRILAGCRRIWAEWSTLFMMVNTFSYQGTRTDYNTLYIICLMLREIWHQSSNRLCPHAIWLEICWLTVCITKYDDLPSFIH